MRLSIRVPPWCLVAEAILLSAPAQADNLKPIVDTRLRYESVDQTGIAKAADAITARARFGIEVAEGPFSFLVEAEGTIALDESYFSGINRKSTYPIVADPENIEINRIQLQYKEMPGAVVTAGRQRINLIDQRFVGSVGWRQNEQTFDAARIEWTGVEKLTLDFVYSWSVRTIWGVNGGSNGFDTRPQAIGGDNIFANASYHTALGTLTGFFYRIDQDEPPVTLQRNSSNTFGARFAGTHPLSETIKWGFALSYARQQDNGANPLSYSADYLLVESSLDIAAFRLAAGVEQLGADRSVTDKATSLPFAEGFAFQTPLATLHKFQGWADKFLTTPPQGITDYYASAAHGWERVGPFDTIAATAAYHRFNSDVASIRYGDEINLQLQATVRKYTITAKFADYRRKGNANFGGDADTRKFWLSLEYML